MSEAPQNLSSDHTSDQITAEMSSIDLSALLSSRVCHDLINPVGAISSGLSMLDDTTSDDTMRDMANSLVREGTEKALALLSFARLAFGAAGGYGTQIKSEDAQEVLVQLYATTKADLDWQVPVSIADKNRIKVLLILAASASECIPRGGKVVVTGSDSGYNLEITGKRLFLNDEFITALHGDSRNMKPKFTPAYLAGLLAREQAGSVQAIREDERIIMSAHFPPATS